MQYYSDKTKKMYPNEAECVAAEKAFDERQAQLAAERETAAQVRRERAKEVEDAYARAHKLYLEAKAKEKEIYKPANEAAREAVELRNKFIKDFGSFHMTVRNTSPMPSVVGDLSDLLNMLFF